MTVSMSETAKVATNKVWIIVMEQQLARIFLKGKTSSIQLDGIFKEHSVFIKKKKRNTKKIETAI